MYGLESRWDLNGVEIMKCDRDVHDRYKMCPSFPILPHIWTVPLPDPNPPKSRGNLYLSLILFGKKLSFSIVRFNKETVV